MAQREERSDSQTSGHFERGVELVMCLGEGEALSKPTQGSRIHNDAWVGDMAFTF